MGNVLITGASRGLGKAIKDKFIDEGYVCFCPTHDELDLESLESINDYFKKLTVDIDVLVNNAGINIKSSLSEINSLELSSMISTNLVGPLEVIKNVVPVMAERGVGRVVNIGSIWGVRSKEFRTMYSMTKFGIDGMTRALAREYGSSNVLFNTVAPGFMETEMTSKNLSKPEQDSIVKDIPLGRFASPSEIAEVVFFLGSLSNTYISGQTIIVDGGFLA